MWLDGAFYACLFPSASLQSHGRAKALMVVLLLDIRLNRTDKKYIYA